MNADRALRILAAAALLELAACGGGGSDAGPSYALHFTPGQLTARFFHNQLTGQNTYALPPVASVTGTIDPIPSGGTLYVVLVLDHPVFTGSPLVSSLGGNAFSLSLVPDVSVTPGTHTGSVEIRLYGDAALTKRYAVTGGTLPYTLTVDPELTVTVAVDGVTLDTVFGSSSTAVTQINSGTIYWKPFQPASAFTVAPGQVLSLHASVPVRWLSPDQLYPYGYLWDADLLATTDTSLVQTVAPPPSGFSGMTGNPYVAMPVGGGQFGAGFLFDVVQP